MVDDLPGAADEWLDPSWALEAIAKDRTSRNLDSIDNSGIVPIPPLGQPSRVILRMRSKSPRTFVIHAAANLLGTTMTIQGGQRRGTVSFLITASFLANVGGTWQGTPGILHNIVCEWFQLAVNPTANVGPTSVIQAWTAPGATVPEAIEFWLERIADEQGERFDRALLEHDERARAIVAAAIRRLKLSDRSR